MDVIGYCRVSTDHQAVEGVSLDAQAERIRAWCRAKGEGHDLVAIHEDAGLSGKRADNRPGLARALQETCDAKGLLVVYSLSRLARSVRDTLAIAERLDRAEANLASLTEDLDTTTAVGKMFFRLMAVLAEFERDLVSERTRTALAWKRAHHERCGQVPYGSRLATDGVSILTDPAELALIDRIVALAESHVSLRAIAATLQAEGVPTKTGGRWSHRTIARILARAASAAITP